jgi:hypothetical protein
LMTQQRIPFNQADMIFPWLQGANMQYVLPNL